MHPNPNVQLLLDEITIAIKKAGQNTSISLREYLEAICHLLSEISDASCKASSSVEDLNIQEQTILALANQAIRPIFEAKRQSLLSQLPSPKENLSKEQILDQLKQMLFSRGMTPDEGLALVGELVSTVTYLRSSTVQNPAQVKAIEAATLDHIKGKLSLALDAIQVEQGFVTKQ